MENQYHFHASAQFHEHDRSFVELEHGAPRIIHFSAPPEFGGEPGAWTPEHFLLAGVTSCYIATFKAVARASKLEFQGIEVTADGLVERESGGYRFTKITLRPSLIVYREESREFGLRLLEKAERICLVSRSLLSKIELEPKIFVENPVAV